MRTKLSTVLSNLHRANCNSWYTWTLRCFCLQKMNRKCGVKCFRTWLWFLGNQFGEFVTLVRFGYPLFYISVSMIVLVNIHSGTVKENASVYLNINFFCIQNCWTYYSYTLLWKRFSTSLLTSTLTLNLCCQVP